MSNEHLFAALNDNGVYTRVLLRESGTQLFLILAGNLVPSVYSNPRKDRIPPFGRLGKDFESDVQVKVRTELRRDGETKELECS